MAQYYISGIWKDATKITHVMLHPISADGGVLKGAKATEQHVISLLNNYNVVSTIEWNYHTARWQIGASVKVVREFNGECLRSHKDNTINDNLNNLIRMEYFF